MGEFDSFIKFLQRNITDYWPLHRFLYLMRWAIKESRDGHVEPLGLKCYYKNVEGFNATYVFTTEDKTVQVTALFSKGTMRVKLRAEEKWDLKIVFKDVPALWRLIISGGNNIVDAILANEAQVYGNLNYLYKLGFLVKDLIKRLELD